MDGVLIKQFKVKERNLVATHSDNPWPDRYRKCKKSTQKKHVIVICKSFSNSPAVSQFTVKTLYITYSKRQTYIHNKSIALLVFKRL